MKISVSMDTTALFSELRRLKCEALPQAAARALNKVGVSARATAIKTLATEVGLAQKAVRPAVGLQKARLHCCDAVVFVVKGKRLPLIVIDPRAKQKAVGVSYRGTKGMQRSLPHAFIATMPSGHRGIYQRKPGARRLPIVELKGPSLAYVFEQPALQNALQETIRLRWPIVCEHELRWELQRRRLT